jgi:ABC-2 type transport system permease protein
VLEVLLSSVTPEELLLGKMLGLGAAGLLQTISFGLIGLGPLVVLGLSRMPGWGLLGMMGSSVLGFAEYASLMAASGAIAGNRHEGRQVSVVWTLIAMLPVFVLPMFLGRPDAPLPLALSLFPLTAPVALTLRLGLGTVPLWQAGLSMALMAGMAWLAWRLGSRVFRVGILMTGARPPLRQVWGWMRQG